MTSLKSILKVTRSCIAGAREILKNIISAVELELIFDDTYNKYLTFSDIEKYLNEILDPVELKIIIIIYSKE